MSISSAYYAEKQTENYLASSLPRTRSLSYAASCLGKNRTKVLMSNWMYIRDTS